MFPPADRSPICFLIGRGASLSSEAPDTAEVIAELTRHSSEKSSGAMAFGSRQLSADEHRLVSRLFEGVIPHIGYRAVAAMATNRPIVIVDLNWDDCPAEACRRVGLRDDWVDAVSLQDTEAVASKLDELLEEESGLLSVHVNGRIEDPDEKGLLFRTKRDLNFEPREFELLQEMLNLRTFVIGTSLAGRYDATKLIDALKPPKDLPDAKVEKLTVLERGPVARIPNPATEAGSELTRALIGRYSPSNFIAAPDVDFDALLVAMRSAEVGFEWKDVMSRAPAGAPRHEPADLVPPSPAAVRPLLDAPGLLVGRFAIGKWSVAHQVAHWLAILAEEPPELISVRGGEAIAAALADVPADGPRPVIVGSHCFGRDGHHPCPELVTELLRLDPRTPGVILTSRPAPWFATLEEMPALDLGHPRVIPFQATEVWEERALRAYARRRSPHDVGVVEAIGRSELSTPLDVDRAIDEGGVGSRGADERDDLKDHLARLRLGEESLALALALIRLQDMSHAVPLPQLKRTCEQLLPKGDKVDLTPLIHDPWELVTPFQIDDEYLRIARREAVKAIDSWMDADRDWLTGRITELGEPAKWARDALVRWERMRDLARLGDLSSLDPEMVELLGPELIEPALGASPKEAMRVLETMFSSAQDSWALREAAFELVRRWETLRQCPKAHDLRDSFIGDKKRRGMYALFEAMLRHGGVAPMDLWTPVVDALIGMSRRLKDRGNRRQVALCFDALLWRDPPVDEKQHRMLLKILLEAAERSKLLCAAFAMAAAYHWDGARRLAAFDLPNPLDRLGNVTAAQAREMAWVIEWHFVHQSRNRALASRRYFRSTRPVQLDAGEGRLLSRKPLDAKLPDEAAKGIVRVVRELVRFPDTAGWAVHMIMNIRATYGRFDAPNLAEVIGRISPTDAGLIWAAIAYDPERLKAQLENALANDESRAELQKALSGALQLDETKIVAPRFVTTLNPWEEVRERWGMNTDLLVDLGLAMDKPWQLVEIAREVRDQAVEITGMPEVVDELIEAMAAADTRLIEQVHSSDIFDAEEGSVRARVLTLLVFAAEVRAHKE